MRWKIYIITAVSCGLIVASWFLWRLEIRPQLIQKRIMAEVQYENNQVKKNLKDEIIRLAVLAETEHPKCPIKSYLTSNYFSGHRVPAYPHLSDIYLYVVPPMKQSPIGRLPNQDKTGNAYGFKYDPMTVEDIEKVREEIRRRKPTHKFQTTAIELLESLQQENLTPIILNILQETLAYCTVDSNGIPKGIKIVDSPRHANLEQEDALTIVVGAVHHRVTEGFCMPIVTVPAIELYTAQYIPRWNVFPSQILQAFHTHKSVHGFLEAEGDPYSFANITVTNYLPIPAPALDWKQHAHHWFSGRPRTNLNVRYQPIRTIDEK